jgi:LacI family transcriptional regulator
LAQWDGDGLIASIHDDDFAAEIRASGVAAVNVAAVPGFPTVTLDNAAAGRLTAEYLIEQGHRHFGYVGRKEGVHGPQPLAAFAETIRRAGLGEAVYEPAPYERMPVRWQSVQNLLARWLKSLPKPIGVMTCDDFRGREVIEAARVCGVIVPNEVAVVGFSNDEMICEFCNPPLSSISIQGERRGYEAARLLDHLMKGGSPPAEPILIPPGEVVVRRSSDMLAVADADLAAAVRFIREHGNKPIGVTDVLDEIAISRRSLERRFSDVVGHSPWREIRIAQIAHVKKLLAQTNMSVSQIAEASAFSNSMRLCRIFKEETKMTPTAYRRRFGVV